MVHCQDAANAADQRPHKMVHAGEIQRLQAGPDNAFVHLRQG
jgi:hypothetical protein